MKYLKSINEYYSSELTDVKIYCENHLVDLLDKEFTISVDDTQHGIEIFLHDKMGFKWDDIKDEFIPFFDMLQSDYILEYQIRDSKQKHLVFGTFGIHDDDDIYYHKDEVEKIDIKQWLRYIKICVKKQKSY